MAAGLRSKKATNIVYKLLGVPVTMRETYRKPRRSNEPLSSHYDMNKIVADDSGNGERYV